MAGSKIDFSSGFSGVSGIKYVVQGATLKCTGCPAPTNLKVMPRSALIEGKPAATIIDSVPQMNIPNFPGPCSFLPKKPPCKVNTGGNIWSNDAPTELITTVKQPALIQTATVKCNNGGIISIIDPGQATKDFNQGDQLDTSKLEQKQEDIAHRLRDLDDLEMNLEARRITAEQLRSMRQLDRAEQMMLDHFSDSLGESLKMHKELGGTMETYPLKPSNIINNIKNFFMGK